MIVNNLRSALFAAPGYSRVVTESWGGRRWFHGPSDSHHASQAQGLLHRGAAGEGGAADLRGSVGGAPTGRREVAGVPTEISVSFVDATTTQRGVGVVAPFDFALDRELWRWVPDNVSLYLTRMPYFPTPVTISMANSLSERSTVRRATYD